MKSYVVSVNKNCLKTYNVRGSFNGNALHDLSENNENYSLNYSQIPFLSIPLLHPIGASYDSILVGYPKDRFSHAAAQLPLWGHKLFLRHIDP